MSVKYEGQYLNGKKHGFGKLTIQNMFIYEGEFVKEKKPGLQILEYTPENSKMTNHTEKVLFLFSMETFMMENSNAEILMVMAFTNFAT